MKTKLEVIASVMAQHVRVKLGPNDVDVRLAPGGRPLTYEGQPFAGGPLPYGSDFYLDRVRFRQLDLAPLGAHL